MAWQFQDDRPIWVQLTEQLTAYIVTGAYAQGSRLPTVRELASQSGVNPNTAQRALAQLEQEGLAVSDRSAGRTVTQDAAAIDRVRVQMAQGIAQKYLHSMAHLGYDTAQAVAYLHKKEEQGGETHERT